MFMRSLGYRLLLIGVLTCIEPGVQARGRPAEPFVAVGAQYDTSHVYVAPQDVNRFIASFLATFGGASTKQFTVTVTPTPSLTTSQLLQTPEGTVSLFGFKTPVPYPFGAERTGYLVTNLDTAIRAARVAGAALVVAPFPDPIGRDAVIQWPGGVDMQLYWHFKKPHYAPFATVPENRVYLSADRANAFLHSFLAFAHGHIVSDDRHAPGIEIGLPQQVFRCVRAVSPFGNLTVLVTDGHLPYPYGRETTGYAVPDLAVTLAKARAAGVRVLAPQYTAGGRTAVMVEFPGGYVAEIHSVESSAASDPKGR
jgi:predicted enzyme related to lactoylglutathione lyase